MENFWIGFSTAKKDNPFSWLIKKADGSEFSHMYIKFYMQNLDRMVVYHASRSFMHFVEYDRFKTSANVIEEVGFTVTSQERSQILQLCVDLAGVRYGMTTLLGIGLRLFITKIGLKFHNPFADGDKSYICSEFVYKVCKILGSKEELSSENETLKPMYYMVKDLENMREVLR